MGTIARMDVRLGLDGSDFERGVERAKQSGAALAANMQKIGGAMTAGLTLPILGVAAASVKMANDLNKSLANVGSLGVGAERLKEMKKGIQDLSIETAQSTDDIAAGMYEVVSAFGDGADAMKILRINTKAAKAGLASIPDTIKMTSAVTKAWGDTSAEAVQHVADLGLKTVELGQTTLPELATSVQGVTLMSKNLSITQEELFAVMAAGTGVIGSASEVATKLRGAQQAFLAPNAAMTKAITEMGYQSAQAMIEQEGLGNTFLKIAEYAEDTNTPITDLYTSVEGLQFAMFMAGEGADQYAKKLDAMQNVTGKTDEAFLAQTQGINKVGFNMEQLQRYVEVLGQKLGDGLAPALATVLDRLMPFADQVVALADAFVALNPAVQGWILAGIALAAALGPLLLILPGIAQGVAVLAGAVAVLTGPVGLAIAAVALLGAAWIFNWGGIQEKTAAVWASVQPKLAEMLAAAQAYAGVQFSGFVAQLGELEKINIPDWLKVVGALFTGGQAAGQGIQTIPLSVEITPTVIQQGGASFVWEDGFLTFDAQGNLKTLNQEGFFGESTGINWDSAQGFWMTINGKVAFDQTDINTNVGLIEAYFASYPIALSMLPKFSADFWGSMTTNAALIQSYFDGFVIVAEWAQTSLTDLGTSINAFFADINNAADVSAEWDSGVMLTLWQDLQDALKEKVRVFGEWGSNVFTDLWDKITSFFSGRKITLGTTFDTSKAGKAGEYVDINPAYPTAQGRYPQGESARALGGPARGLTLVGENGPELAFFGGAGADILSNPNSIEFLQSMGIRGFASGTMPPPPIGPKLSPPSYNPTQRPEGLYPPIGNTAVVGAALMDASESMSSAAESIAESTTAMTDASGAFRSALESVPGLFGASEVTADQQRMADMGIPQEFADNYLRRLTDEVVNGVDWEGVDIGDAAAAAGIDPNLPATAILEMFKQAWNDSSLFANPENLKFIDQSAVKAAIQKQQDQLAGQMNILALFGIKDEGIATQVAGLGEALANNFQTQMTPELLKPVGESITSGIATGLGDSAGADTGAGNMIGAIQTALTKAEMQAKMSDAGESAASVYWGGWVKFFSGVTIPTPTPPGGGSAPALPGMASGGPVSGGVPYIVGERGRELFIPNVSGQIIPHDEIGGVWDMSSMGGSGVTLNNYGPIASEVDVQALAWQVAQLLGRRR